MVRRGVAVAELHWSAFHPWFFRVAEEIEWRHTQPFQLDGVTVQVFDEPLTLLHLAAHFAQHAFYPARILRDVAAAWNTWHDDVDHGELQRLARVTGTQRALEFALRAAHDMGLLLAPAPRTGSRRVAVVRRLLPTRRLFGQRTDPEHARRALVFVVTGLRRWPRYLIDDMFPPIEGMAVIYRRRITWRLYLHYATRPFRALRRAVWTRPPRRSGSSASKGSV
jgi:hypothetical protein